MNSSFRRYLISEKYQVLCFESLSVLDFLIDLLGVHGVKTWFKVVLYSGGIILSPVPAAVQFCQVYPCTVQVRSSTDSGKNSVISMRKIWQYFKFLSFRWKCFKFYVLQIVEFD